MHEVAVFEHQFVQHDRYAAALTQGQRFPPARAGGFEHEIQPGRQQAEQAQGLFGTQPAVGVDEEKLARLATIQRRPDALGIQRRAALSIAGADLDRVAAITTRAVVGDAGAHVLRATSVDRGDHRHPLPGRAAQQRMDRQSQRLSGEIPDREVDGRLGVVMARQMLVHGIPDPVGQSRVATEHAGRHFLDPGAHTARVRGDVSGAEGRALAPALQPGIGAQPDKGRIEAVVVPTMGQAIGAAGVGQVQLENIEGGDFHRPQTAVNRPAGSK